MSITPRTDFGKAPKGYVSGAGRGAVGFTTRSDIGPARQAVVPVDRSISAQKERARQIFLQRQSEVTPSIGTTSTTATTTTTTATSRNSMTVDGVILPTTSGGLVGSIASKELTQSNEDLSESNYDSFTGYSTSLFSAGVYDEEDEEADQIFQAIDNRMDSKRKERRDQREREQWLEYHKKRAKVDEMFIKEKVELSKLKEDDWSQIPDAVDLSRLRMLQKKNVNHSTRSEKYTPVPDSVIENARRGVSTNAALGVVDEIEQRYGGYQTVLPPSSLSSGTTSSLSLLSSLGTTTSLPGTTSSNTTDLTQLGRARDRHLGLQLDKMADSVTGQTVVDPKGYLTDLTTKHITSDTDVSDIRKARQLLKSVITTNPKHPPGWIAAARLEEAAGKIQAARSLILKGTDACATSQDIWLEAARLHDKKEAKSILARAVFHIPKSVKLWMKAGQFEDDIEAKKAVLRRALEIIPNSVAIWKAAVELENPNDAKIMLSRAVECVPTSVEMWLALARLETYENAKKILNRARAANPTDPSIFIAAAKLEEANNNYEIIPTIIKKAISSLQNYKVVIDRDAWLQEAAKCENNQCPITCQAIVRECIGIDVEEQDRRDRWSQEAKEWLAKGQIEVSRAIYAEMLKEFPDRWKIWWDAAILEKKHGTAETTEIILKKAVTYCRKAVKLWLLAAKEKWMIQKDVEGARKILEEAFSANPQCEEIWLAAVKIEAENKLYDNARNILKHARLDCTTPKVWMKSAMLERCLGNYKLEKEILDEALTKFDYFDKLWLMRGQLSERNNNYNECRSIFVKAVEKNPYAIDIWLEYARIEGYSAQRISKARSILETARIKIKNCDRLWLAAAQLEIQSDNINNIKQGRGYTMAKSLLSKGLQECPNSGLLWSFAIEIEPFPSRKSKCVLAIKKCNNDVHVFTSAAKFFVINRKIKQARDWFERAITSNPNWGDAWAYYYKFALLFQKDNDLHNNILQRCIEAEPKHGFEWIKVSKKVGNEFLNTKDILLQVSENVQLE